MFPETCLYASLDIERYQSPMRAIVYPPGRLTFISALGLHRLFWMEARQTELPLTVWNGSCFQLRLQGDQQANQSHRSGPGKRAIQFLKAAVSVFKGRRSERSLKTNRDSKTPQHCSLKVSFFSFLLNVKSHVSLSPSISQDPPTYKIGITPSSHPFAKATNNTFVYIYSQTERTVDGGRYLFIKRWVKDRFTLGMWSNYCLELPTKCLGIWLGHIPKPFYQTDFICRTHIKINNICFF